MINKKESTKISKFLSLVLRHAPETIHLELDSQGWTDINILIEKMNANGTKVDRETIDYVVENNEKKRFAISEDGKSIRANQGHSIKIDHGFEPVTPPEILYHGTGHTSVASILQNGIDKRNRHHVHLSEDKDTAKKVGQRHGKPTILRVAALEMYQDGLVFYKSDNDVWLTESVPVKYISSDSVS